MSIRTLISICCGAFFIAGMAWADESEISPRIKRQLDGEVLPALSNANKEAFFQAYGDILERASRELVDAIEQYAQDQKLESPLAYYVGLVIEEIERGNMETSREVSLDETDYFFTGVNARLQSFVAGVNKHPFMEAKIEVPESWKSAQDLFWKAHIINNEFLNNNRVIEYGNQLLSSSANRIKASSSETLKNSVLEFKRLKEQIRLLETDLAERAAEARLVRLERSVAELPTYKTFKQRFIAAMNIELDSEKLVPFLKNRSSYKREALNRPKLIEEIEFSLAKVRAQESELLEKARLFREGAHAWMRGRYGMAELGNGLLKPKEAIRSRDKMVALYMPRSRPVPYDNFIGSPNTSPEMAEPVYKRRHYYTWALEYRPILSSYTQETIKHDASSSEIVSTGKKNWNNGTFFY